MKKHFDIILLLFFALLIGGYVTFERYNNSESQKHNDLYLAVFQFEKGDYRKSLIGDDTFIGFFDFVNKYRNNVISDIGRLYIGICLIKIKDYENGIAYLKSVKIKEPILKARCIAFIANAFVENKQYEKAIEYFIKATKCFKNDIDNPSFIMNAVLCYEQLGQYKNALNLIEKCLDDYNNMSKYEDFIKKKKQLENKIYAQTFHA